METWTEFEEIKNLQRSNQGVAVSIMRVRKEPMVFAFAFPLKP